MANEVGSKYFKDDPNDDPPIPCPECGSVDKFRFTVRATITLPMRLYGDVSMPTLRKYDPAIGVGEVNWKNVRVYCLQCKFTGTMVDVEKSYKV